ncbi:hybrid sensor histidine kinase/response regulator transcription factor [Hymenobacter negativus]|uniref:histidine kinase n=1 Tax=Hymenobacter negativus TaxID=2795026 RepID=A0ABS0Q9K7_9BACT|nr:ATP-binding protein [Hymenobacter negativus]MBH8559364.1 response regulator [Hymenobacter negativus]
MGLLLPAQARFSPQQLAQSQRRLQAGRFGYRYWDARHDSLRRVLAGQRADTLRLHTLDHLFRLTDFSQDPLPLIRREHQQALAIARRLRIPEQVPWRLLVAYDRLSQAPVPNLAAMRDTLQAAIRAYDALGGHPIPFLLETLGGTQARLGQLDAVRSFFERQRATYQQRGEAMNEASCCRVLSSYYRVRGDYNQAISMRMRATELFRGRSVIRYYNELGVVGLFYTEWNNDAQALPYLRRAVAWPGLGSVFWAFLNRTIARAYLRLGNYSLAQRFSSQALRPHSPAEPVAAYDRTLGLVQQSAVLLALGRPTAAHPLLIEAQHLADSLHLPLRSSGGDCELAATWARYYAARGDADQTEAAWHRAYQQARQAHVAPLRLGYLRALAGFYQHRGQANRATPYALAALALADTLDAAEAATHVARYEFDQAAQAQQQRVERLRRAQLLSQAQARQQHTALSGLLAVLAVLGGLAVLLWRTSRRKSRDNALLAAQQQQLEAQAERLGELDAAKNQFFANASHELRTPLTLVLGPLETLLDDPAQKLPAAARRAVARAHRQARRLNELVNRILDLTKLQAGRLPVQATPTAVAPLLHQVVEQFGPLAASRALVLRGPELVPEELRLLVDADKVNQILTNLLSNALNHTPPGGTVTLETALPAADGFYTLTVRDTGPGIAPAEQERVFERFYQSPQNQTQGGTGLGLALSRELAALLGGTLTLASVPGQGAAFTLRFPAVELGVKSGELRVEEPELGDAKAEVDIERSESNPVADSMPAHFTPSVTPPTLNSTKPRVLVVEDEPDLREYLHELLAPTCEVLTAPDGQAALELLARDAPVDLITTDAMMPRLSGTELIAKLKADPRLTGVPVLMLTARADAAHRRAALTVGVDDYLTKPFAPAELLARVQVLLERHAVRRQFAAQPQEASAEPDAPAAALTSATPAASETAAEATVTTPVQVPAEAGAQLAQWEAQVAGHLANEQFGPAELAALLAMSERTLYRRLGKLAGLTPAAWLRELRLHQARQLLEAGDFGSVAAVADAVGFATAKYFSACYAERFGRLPSEYGAGRE